MDSVDNIPENAEQIMHVFTADNDLQFSRFRLNGSDYVYFLEDHNRTSGSFRQAYRFAKWEDCWNYFVERAAISGSWVNAIPVFLHEDYRPFIQGMLLSELVKEGNIEEAANLWKEALHAVKF
jgi:hypothetical protein